MNDVMYLLLIIGSFALLLALAGWCERIVDGGPAPQPGRARAGTRPATADGGAAGR